MLALLVCLLGYFVQHGSAAGCSNTGCFAYEWAIPLWHTANLRFLQANNQVLFVYPFKMNTIAYRKPSTTSTNAVVCDDNLCSGTPQTLNPAPVVSPNWDTIYGSVFFDMQTTYTIKNPAPGARFWSIHIIDMWTNTLGLITSLQSPNGGTYCLVPKGVTANCPAGTQITISNLPRYGQILFRGYSAPGVNGTCGSDGCTLFVGANAFTFSNATNGGTLINPRTVYSPWMTGTNGCTYVYNQPICGTGASSAKQVNFWNAVCQALKENPLDAGSPEAAYVTSKFSSWGITPTGCAANFNASAFASTLSSTNATGGWSVLNAGIQTTNAVKGPWVYLTYAGNWAATGDYTLRAQTTTRLHLMNINSEAVYYTAFTDSSAAPLNGNSASYKLNWDPAAIPIDVANRGFWSVTVYDNSYFFYKPTSPKRWAIRGNTNTQPAEIHFANTCTTGNCVPIPQGAFNIMLRGYVPLPGFIYSSLNYNLPTITKCASATACQ
jgi:hypothetical protein